jgi:hypothetical protein
VLAHARTTVREAETMKAAGRQRTPPRPLRLGLLPTLPRRLWRRRFVRLGALDPEQLCRTEDAPGDLLRQRLASGRYDAILTRLGRVERGHRQIVPAEDRQALAFPRSERPRGQVAPGILNGRRLIVRTHCEFLEPASRILEDWQVRPLIAARTDSDTRAGDGRRGAGCPA